MMHIRLHKRPGADTCNRPKNKNNNIYIDVCIIKGKDARDAYSSATGKVDTELSTLWVQTADVQPSTLEKLFCLQGSIRVITKLSTEGILQWPL